MKLKALKTEQWLNNHKRNFWKLSSLEGTRVWHYFSTRAFTLIFFERHLRNNLVFKKVSIRYLNVMECIPGLGVSLGNLEWGSIFLVLISLNNGHTYSGPGSSFVHAVSEEKDTHSWTRSPWNLIPSAQAGRGSLCCTCVPGSVLSVLHGLNNWYLITNISPPFYRNWGTERFNVLSQITAL